MLSQILLQKEVRTPLLVILTLTWIKGTCRKKLEAVFLIALQTNTYLFNLKHFTKVTCQKQLLYYESNSYIIQTKWLLGAPFTFQLYYYKFKCLGNYLFSNLFMKCILRFQCLDLKNIPMHCISISQYTYKSQLIQQICKHNLISTELTI